MTYKRLVQKGEIKSPRDNAVEVQGQLMDEKDWPLKGTIDFVDNQYDRSSGTIRVRAAFPNPDLFITPNQFGRVRVPMSQLRPTLLVPDAAVVTDQSVKMLFTVAPDGTVVPKPVELGPVTDDNLRVIRTGITADDQVIISGLLRARPGQKVTPEQGTIGAPPAAPGCGAASGRGSLMNISHFFIDRPIFAAVISILITLIGGVAYFSLPVAQYPDIAPPSISVTASYPGASADIVAKTVATPIEQEVNGVDNMLYMTSQSTSDGAMSLAVTFKLGTNLDTAQVLVQNRVAIALPRLPEEVRNIGVTVVKQSPDLMMVIHLSSPDDSRDLLYISNYATLHVKDVLARIDGVGNVTIFGARDYSMRIWLDPEKLAARDLTAGDVVNALRGQNVQVAAGVINQPPVPQPGAFQLNVETQGRLTDPASFGNIIVKSESDGRVVRIRDIGRVELGAADYNRSGYLDERVAIPMGIFQRPGSNALQTATAVQAAMAELSKSFPAGIRYDIVYNPTVFISRIGRGGDPDHFRGGDPRRGGDHPLPADLARLGRADRRHPGVADRHLRRAGRARLLAQQSLSVRPRARHRHRGRRRHRRGGECRAQYSRGIKPARRRLPHHGGGGRRADRHRARALRRVHPLGVPHRHSRPVLPPIRRHHRHRHGDLADRVADLEPGALRAAVQAARSRASPEQHSRARGSGASSTASTAPSSGCRRATAR